jgi:hypothetical protein
LSILAVALTLIGLIYIVVTREKLILKARVIKYIDHLLPESILCLIEPSLASAMLEDHPLSCPPCLRSQLTLESLTKSTPSSLCLNV